MEDGAEKQAPESSKAGAMVRAARLAAGVDAAKIGADLRISTAALEALESCRYDRLPGDPYVRALLGSVGRYLRLDVQKLVQAYNSEMGAPSTAPVTPYKDLSQTHVLAHRQIFILILAVLLFALLLLLARLNSGGTSAPTVGDTLPESRSLRPEIPADTAAKPAPIARPDTVRPTEAAAPAKEINRVVVKPLIDSVWIRVLRAGKPESKQLLVLGKQMEVTHPDTIALILSRKKSVELTFGDTTLIPAQKRFRILGGAITYY